MRYASFLGAALAAFSLSPLVMLVPAGSAPPADREPGRRSRRKADRRRLRANRIHVSRRARRRHRRARKAA